MRPYYTSLLVLTLLLLLSITVYSALASDKIPTYGYFGILFLAGLSGFIHHYIYGNGNSDPKKTIRRMMIGSMLRMFAAILFLAITLFAFHPVNIPFVISYTGSFFLLMLFEIYSIRRKLRPDLQTRSK